MDFLKKVFSVTPTAPVAKKGLVMPRDYELKDTRKVSATTGKAINPNRDLVSGKYPSKDIYGIVKAAKRYSIDPYDLLSVSLQETGLNKTGRGLGQVLMSNSEIRNSVPTKMDTEEEADGDEYDMFARAYMSKMKYADSKVPVAANQIEAKCNFFGKRSQPNIQSPKKVLSRKKAKRPSIASGAPKISPTKRE